MVNSDKLRLFIGIKINPSGKIISAINKLQQNLTDAHIKWVNKENYHITLKFLGETPEYYINSIDLILQQSLFKIREFHIVLNGCDIFRKNTPQTIWIGLQKTETLMDIQKNLNKSLSELGFETELRNYKPHLTIGRIKHLKSVPELNKLISKTSMIINEKHEIKQIELIQSTLLPSGPIYNTIQSYKLIH